MFFHSKYPRANVNQPNTFPREKIRIERLTSFVWETFTSNKWFGCERKFGIRVKKLTGQI